MKFSDISSRPSVSLYAGDIPDLPEYRSRPKVGLSLKRDDNWHIRHDITEPIPLPDGIADSYQSEDVFEHIEYSKLPFVIAEARRILKPGGLFRLSVPDYRCDVLRDRSLKDSAGNIVFDPLGGGAYRRRRWFFGEKQVVRGGHIWFPNYETVAALLQDVGFSSIEFLHYYDENGAPHTEPIDYTRGYVQRTPDNDRRVSNPFRPMSIVVDCLK
jgi:SAM-dependent methyltransferase